MPIFLDMGGTGQSHHKWITINLDPGANHSRPDIVADITNKLELEQLFEYQTVDGIRCCHTLEHIDPNLLADTLKLWFDLLKPGGFVEIVVPDLERVRDQWFVGCLPDIVAIRMIYVPENWQAKGELERHRWGFTSKTLTELLFKVGFRNVVSCSAKTTHYVDGYPVPNLKVEGVKPL